VGFKIKADIDTSKLKRILEKKQKLVLDNIATVLQKDALPYLIERIMVGFDSIAERADMLPEDPTNPSNWRGEFLNKLEEDVSQNFFVEGNKIVIRIGDKDFLGYDSSGSIASDDTEPLHWMVFFLEGLIGDWAFISPETYTKITKGGQYRPTWGRFGDGFMISSEEYAERGWDRIVPFSQVRHPFSGFSPLDIFAEALQEFHLRPFIQKAIDAAVKGTKL
jgi:hypothetical protein